MAVALWGSWGTGRPICGKRDHIAGCVDKPCDGL